MSKKTVLIGVLSLFITGGAAMAENTASKELEKLFQDSWEFTLKDNPLEATSRGVHIYNDRLPSKTLEAYERRLARQRGFLDRIEKINKEDLTPDERVSYDIFKRLAGNKIANLEFKTYLMPVTNRGGFHIYFPRLPKNVPLDTVKDYENFIARMKAFKKYTSEHITLMQEGIKQGYVMPGIVLNEADEPIRAHIVDDPEQSLLFSPFKEFPENFSKKERKELTEAGKQAIMESVVPAYEELLAFMEKEYLPACRESIAASDLPKGKAYYEHRVRQFTSLDISPKEVHEKGLSEVKRIRGEMAAIIEKVKFKGDFKDFVEFLRTDEQFYADTPEELLKEVSYVLKKMDGKLPELFGRLPRMPYGIEPIPDFIAPMTTTAYYHGPSGDGTRAGIYFVNTYDLNSRPFYEIEALSLHEAVPGHHLQIALQQELENLPLFRRHEGFTAFVEGWALYAERLGLETGFYEDPYRDFGRLTYEMWRALRLVVDTGIHYFGWTRERAIDFMAENSALSIHNITTEVDRYIAWPGQAIAYKIGELKIRELRATAEKELGKNFDIRNFHDTVLGSGAVPLDVLEKNVRGYIASASSKKH
ncbi:DUF885 family protein [Acidobacteriota bacterium]